MASKVIVTTTTFYADPGGRDKVRFGLVCELTQLAIKAGHTVVVVDGSPVTEVAEELKEIGAHVFAQLEKGMGAGRRQVWTAAGGFVAPDTVAIFWTEEKPDVIHSIPKIIAPICKQLAGAVMAARSPASWETYPRFQRESEQLANLVYNKLYPVKDVSWDPMFGPVCFCPSLLSFFSEMDAPAHGLPDTYLQHFAPVFMRYDGIKVASVEVDFAYPIQQRAEEETGKVAEMLERRLWQARQLVASYFHMHDTHV